MSYIKTFIKGFIGVGMMAFGTHGLYKIWKPELDKIYRIKTNNMTEKDIIEEILPDASFMLDYDANGNLVGMNKNNSKFLQFCYNEDLEEAKLNQKYNKIISPKLLKKLEDTKNTE